MRNQSIETNRTVVLSSIIIVFITSLFLGCSRSSQKWGEEAKTNKSLQDTVCKIDIESVINNVQEVDLSDVVSDIEYIPLELKGDKYLRCIGQIEVTESYIFVHDHQKLFQFTRTGEFVRQIGCVGRGPGEYSDVMHFAVNEEADLIMIQGQYGDYQFNIHGVPKRNTYNTISCFFKFLDDEHLVFYKTNDETRPESIIVTDLELNRLFSFNNNNPKPRTRWGNSKCPFYSYGNKFFYKEHYNDTLFEIGDRKLIPHMIFNESSLLIPKDFEYHGDGTVATLVKQLDKVNDKIKAHEVFESKRKVLVSYIKGMNPHKQSRINILFDKRTKESVVLQDAVFHNNIDGGIDFWPKYLFNDNLMVSGIEAFKLKAYVASDDFKNSQPKYPERKKALEELANSLSENDNPVLMLLKLRE